LNFPLKKRRDAPLFCDEAWGDYMSPPPADNKKMITGPEMTIKAKQVSWKIS
jgi:hypothetical protein